VVRTSALMPGSTFCSSAIVGWFAPAATFTADSTIGRSQVTAVRATRTALSIRRCRSMERIDRTWVGWQSMMTSAALPA
jgi:hypothetical protein